MTWDWCRDDYLAVNQRSGEFICPLAGPLQAGSFPVLLTLRLPARAFTAKVQALYEALVPGPRHLGPYPALLILTRWHWSSLPSWEGPAERCGEYG